MRSVIAFSLNISKSRTKSAGHNFYCIPYYYLPPELSDLHTVPFPLSPSSQNDDSSLFFRHWKNLWPPSNGQELDTTQSLQVQLTTREFEDCIQRPCFILEGLETHKRHGNGGWGCFKTFKVSMSHGSWFLDGTKIDVTHAVLSW